MTDLANLITIGVGAFVATNIDDIFVLMMFFSSTSTSSSSMNFPVRQVVLGQYMGIGLLIAISALGSLIPLVVPPYVIGLLGIVPIVIGSKRLVQMIKKEDKVSPLSMHAAQDKNNRRNKLYLPFLVVAAITFSNGGDNIGVYTPMFAQYNSLDQVTTLIVVFMLMTAVWCIAAYHLVNHPLVASRIRRIGHAVMPFVLIGLGIYILAQGFSFRLFR